MEDRARRRGGLDPRVEGNLDRAVGRDDVNAHELSQQWFGAAARTREVERHIHGNEFVGRFLDVT